MFFARKDLFLGSFVQFLKMHKTVGKTSVSCAIRNISFLSKIIRFDVRQAIDFFLAS